MALLSKSSLIQLARSSSLSSSTAFLSTTYCSSKSKNVHSAATATGTHPAIISSSGRLLSTSVGNTAVNQDLPSQARVVVVGGGIIGTSTLYHLAKLGWKDVVLLERDQLTSGTTWHAAGLMVTFGSLSETSTDFRKYTKSLYSEIENETGLSSGFMPVGFIELATNKDYLEEYRRTAAFNRKCGIDVQEISPKEVQELFPLCNVSDVLAGFYVADDGRVNPVDATMSLAKGARMHGAKIFESSEVTDILHENNKAKGVMVGEHRIDTEYVVNATGMWARQLGEKAGVVIPNQAAEHYYLLTGAMPDVDPSWPVVEDPSSHTYIRPEGGGLMVGLFESEAASWMVNDIPRDFSFGEIEPDWERMGPFVEKAMERVPRSLEGGIKKFFCGPESFTPDLAPVVGESPDLRNYFVAAGMNSIGILTGGGVGRMMANWIIDGQPDVDVTGINMDRFQSYQLTPAYRGDRVVESLGQVYKCHYPFKTPETARNIKLSPVHERHVQRRGCFRDVSGWEGVDWFAPEHVEPTTNPLSWDKPHWFDIWRSEHEACRNEAVLIDMSFMSKFLVEGRDAGAFLNLLSTANVDGENETITYTQWLNPAGKLEADLTVTKMGPNKFMVVASDNMHGHTLNWMKRHVENFDNVFIADMTGAEAQLNIQGPLSRNILQVLTDTDMSNEAFPFRTCKPISIGYARVRCARITYVGELGYELFVPVEFALHVYDRIMDAGEPLGIRPAGLKSLASLRLEKGYRDYGHDIDNTDSLQEVGLTFTADFSKSGGFIGMDAVSAQKQSGVLPKRLLQVKVESPEPMLYHGEVVYRNGECVGDVRAGSYGHTLGGAVGLAMIESTDSTPVNATYVNESEWEIDIAGIKYPATASIRPMLDPKNLKIKA